MNNPQFIEKFKDKIDGLGYYSEKEKINQLTEYAESYIGSLYCAGDVAVQETNAIALTSAIEAKIMQCSPKRLLPIFHMMDSILKNVGLKPKGSIYIHTFQRNIKRMFCSAYDRMPEDIRPKLMRLLNTWGYPQYQIFSKEDREYMTQYPQKRKDVPVVKPSGLAKPVSRKEPVDVRSAPSRQIIDVQNGPARIAGQHKGPMKGPSSSQPPTSAQNALASLAAFSRQQKERSLANPSQRERDILADLFRGIPNAQQRSWEEMMNMDPSLLQKIKAQASQSGRLAHALQPGQDHFPQSQRSRSASPPLGGGAGQSIADMIASKIGPGLPKTKQAPREVKAVAPVATTSDIANMLAKGYQGPTRRNSSQTSNPALKPGQTLKFEKTFSITHDPDHGSGSRPQVVGRVGPSSWMGGSVGHGSRGAVPYEHQDVELKKEVSSEFQKGKVLNKTIPSVIGRLYDDTGTFQCPETGVRFQTEQEYTEYLDTQARSKRMKRDTMSFRHWFPFVEDWATNFADAQNADDLENPDLFAGENTGSQKDGGGETEEDRAAADAARVPISLAPGVTKCVMCEEKFDTVFDDDSGEWMFRNAHTIDIEGKPYIFKTNCFRSVMAAVEAKGGELNSKEMMELIGASDPSTPRGKRHLEDEMKRQLHTLQEAGGKVPSAEIGSEGATVKLEFKVAGVADNAKDADMTMPPSQELTSDKSKIETDTEASAVPAEKTESSKDDIDMAGDGNDSGNAGTATVEVGDKREAPTSKPPADGEDGEAQADQEDVAPAGDPAGKKKRARFK